MRFESRATLLRECFGSTAFITAVRADLGPAKL